MWKLLFSKYGIYLVLGVMFYALWYYANQASVYHQKAEDLELTINDLSQNLTKTKIRLNDSVSICMAEIKSLTMTKDNIQARYDQLLKSTKTNKKDVGNVTQVATATHSKDTVIALVDSFGGIKANLSDSFVDIDVEVLPNRNTIINYEMRDSLTLLNIQKKHSWLFGLIKWKEHKGLRVINHNPKAEITHVQTIDVIE